MSNDQNQTYKLFMDGPAVCTGHRITKAYIIRFHYTHFSWGIRWPINWPMPRADVVWLGGHVIALAVGVGIGLCIP